MRPPAAERKRTSSAATTTTTTTITTTTTTITTTTTTTSAWKDDDSLDDCSEEEAVQPTARWSSTASFSDVEWREQHFAHDAVEYATPGNDAVDAAAATDCDDCDEQHAQRTQQRVVKELDLEALPSARPARPLEAALEEDLEAGDVDLDGVFPEECWECDESSDESADDDEAPGLTEECGGGVAAFYLVPGWIEAGHDARGAWGGGQLRRKSEQHDERAATDAAEKSAVVKAAASSSSSSASSSSLSSASSSSSPGGRLEREVVVASENALVERDSARAAIFRFASRVRNEVYISGLERFQSPPIRSLWMVFLKSHETALCVFTLRYGSSLTRETSTKHSFRSRKIPNSLVGRCDWWREVVPAAARERVALWERRELSRLHARIPGGREAFESSLSLSLSLSRERRHARAREAKSSSPSSSSISQKRGTWPGSGHDARGGALGRSARPSSAAAASNI